MLDLKQVQIQIPIIMKIITRYELITQILKDNHMSESERILVANFPDEVIFNTFGKQQFKSIRKGYYTLNI